MPYIVDQYSDRELELYNLIENGAPLWLPNPDNIPQVMAYLSDATVLGYGGAAGGGKTDLIIGKALNQHSKTMIVREEGTQMTSIIDRLSEVLKSRDGFNGQERIWRLLKREQQIEFGSIPNLGDERKYQGRPHDFLAFDEATNILVQQIRFLFTWLRSTVPGQRTEVLLTFNPPSSAEGRWVMPFFAPWLETHTAAPGDLRYFITVEQTDIEVPDQSPCIMVNKEPLFEFNAANYKPNEIITPQSRTFIPAKVGDNSYLGSEYMAVLQSLPEPLRSQMLDGDFEAGIEDDQWQVIPTEWVRKAMDRWQKKEVTPRMDSMGVDVARGGRDNTIIFRRHGRWFDIPLAYPGSQTPDGPSVMAQIVTHMRDQAPVHLDVVGVGGSPYDFLRIARFQVAGVNGGEKSNETTKEGRMGFANLKSELWWKMREALDPAHNRGIALPSDSQLLADLTALTWQPEGAKIRVESRKAIIKRTGRSPDWGSACVLALLDTPKRSEFLRSDEGSGEYDPYAILN